MMVFYNGLLYFLEFFLYVALPFLYLFNKPLYFEISERLKPHGIRSGSFHPIWVQASSIGEVILAEKIIKAIKEIHPEIKILLTTTTPSGLKLAKEKIKKIEWLRYFPFDFKRTIRHFLDQFQPKLFIMIETEIWPNLLMEMKRRNISCMIANGRISNKSYKKYLLIKPLLSKVLKSLTSACMSSTICARRIIQLGLPSDRVIHTGNIKFDTPIHLSHDPPSSLKTIMGLKEDQEIFLAGSTAEGEDTLIIDAYLKAAKMCQHPILLIAPRHPQRTPALERLINQKGLTCAKLSSLKKGEGQFHHDIIIIDTIGDLSTIYSFGTIIFIGGSLVPKGGHNILEPAAFEKPVLFGKYMDNFQEMAQSFVKNGAGFMVQDENDLSEMMIFLLKNQDVYHKAGQKAKEIVHRNTGALERTLKEIEKVLGTS